MPDEIDVAALRGRLRMTQRAFAEAYGIAFSTLRDWEHGRREPDQTARTYLRVIAAKPASVREALAEPVKDGDARATHLVKQVETPKTSHQPRMLPAKRTLPLVGKVVFHVPRIVEDTTERAPEAARARTGIRIRI